MKINVLVHWHGTANDSGRSYCLPARRLNVPYNANTPFAKQVGQVRVAGTRMGGGEGQQTDASAGDLEAPWLSAASPTLTLLVQSKHCNWQSGDQR